MARGKGGAKAHGQERPNTLAEKERQICPLCIEPLDPTEKRFFPCPCGYQVCLFCFRRLKEEFSNQCPGCRTVYGSDFDPGRRARNEAKQERNGHDLTAVPTPGSLQRPVSPLRISALQQQQQQHQQQQQQQSEKQPDQRIDKDTSRAEHLPARAPSPFTLPAPLPTSLQAEGNGVQQVPQQPPPALLQQLSQGPPVTPDPDGAALLASTQQRVANGGLSVREAARLLVSFLRAKQAAADPSAQGSSFYSAAANGLSKGFHMEAPAFSPPTPSISFQDSFQEQRGPSPPVNSTGGLLSSLLGEAERASHNAQSQPAWPSQQPQKPEDDLMRLLWGTHSGQQGPRQGLWAHSPQANGRSGFQMDGHVPLYARTRNGMHHDLAAQRDLGEKANGVHVQNGFATHGSWLATASMSPELAAVAMAAPPK